jgi:cytochrome c556
MKMNSTRGWLLSAASALTLSVTAALGHGGASGIVGERMMGMMMLGEQVKLLTPMFAGDAELDLKAIKGAASMITMHAGSAMTDLFPEGSLDVPSEALPAIWDRWPEFVAYAQELGKLGRELDAAAAAPAPTPAAPAPVALTEPTTPLEQMLSEWNNLEADVLLGVSERENAAPIEIDDLITGSVSVRADQVSGRTAPEVFADIAETCSSCHSAFRR